MQKVALGAVSVVVISVAAATAVVGYLRDLLLLRRLGLTCGGDRSGVDIIPSGNGGGVLR